MEGAWGAVGRDGADLGVSQGFRPPQRVFVLNFEDDDYAGLVVRARSVKLGSFLEVASLAQINPSTVKPEDVQKFTALFREFAKALVEWNLTEEDGTAVPATFEGVTSLDVDFVMPIIQAWMAGIAGVSSPLGQPSSNGEQSEAPPLPMAALSEPQGS